VLWQPTADAVSGTPTVPPPLLCRATLGAVDGSVTVPTYDERSLSTGLAHLGVSSFHRAHQAVYLHRLAQAGDRRWGLVGVSARRGTLREELLSQDCLYTVTELDAGVARTEVVGVLRDYLSAVSQADAVRTVLGRPETSVVTVTVTAPTYAEPQAGRPVFRLLAEALDRRRRRGLAPFAVLSCDNLPRNGDTLRDCVSAAAADQRLSSWIASHVAFPNSMVDRITPPPPGEHARHLRRRTGVQDRAALVTEPFTEWVLEDFDGPRPPLEDVGVQVVSDVGPHVALKTGVLNAGHFALGFLGGQVGARTTDVAIRHPTVRRAVRDLVDHEVLPLLPPVQGVDLHEYVALTLDRYANPAVADPLSRLRRRASTRYRSYVLPPLERALAAGGPHDRLVRVTAAWVRHVRAWAAATDAGTRTRTEILDEMGDTAAEALLLAARVADRDVRPFLTAAGLPSGVVGHHGFVAALQESLHPDHEDRRAVAS
jgi:mannitol 2-dehydrogenase